MQSQKYSVNQHLIDTILNWVEAGEIAIPEIQRPFVWNSTKVRNLIDSLYRGYPVGYLIAWRNPSARLKDGSISEGKKILIDGQQRVTAMTAALLGKKIVNADYQKKRIRIAFHPLEERFEVLNPAIAKDVAWIPDISPIIKREVSLLSLIRDYCQKNQNITEEQLEVILQKLQNIVKQQIGLIELSGELDIETVTEIFVRINSAGTVLSQADFAMSKIASNEELGGPNIRKCIDYFCHLRKDPDFFNKLEEIDSEFFQSEYTPHLKWLANYQDTIYQPDYKDVIRVVFVSEFNRGKLSDLVGLLSGRNFKTKTYEISIVQDTFKRFNTSLLRFVNETNFKRFVMIIRSTGLTSPSRFGNALSFAHILYLKLRSLKYRPEDIEKFVRKWFIMSILTGRYSGSAESIIDSDIKDIEEKTIQQHLADIESAQLSDAFWQSGLIQKLNTSNRNSPYFHVYLAAQVKNNDRGFLSKSITVSDLLNNRGDIHHLFPKNFLRKHGKSQKEYNQLANYVYMQTEINIAIADQQPKDYFAQIRQQIDNNQPIYGSITDYNDLLKNLRENAIPEMIMEATINDYETFLQQRRQLIAKKIHDYYFSL